MKFLLLIFISLMISSCKNDEKKEFIVSRFNKNIEKYKQNKIVKNSEYEYIEEIDEFDYPKGAVNFIFLKDNSIFYYSEELIDNWCGWRPKKTDLIKEHYQMTVYIKLTLIKLNFYFTQKVLKRI